MFLSPLMMTDVRDLSRVKEADGRFLYIRLMPS